MRVKISDPDAHALLEVEVTLHPEAIRQALFSRHGLMDRLLRGGIAVIALYLAAVLEMSLPQYWLELRMRPLPMAVAYVAVRFGMIRGGIAAMAGGIALSAWCGGSLPLNCLAMVAGACTPPLLFPELPPLARKGWTGAAFCGGTATLAAALIQWLAALPMPPGEAMALLASQAALAAALNAVVYAPVIFFSMDAMLHPGKLLKERRDTAAPAQPPAEAS